MDRNKIRELAGRAEIDIAGVTDRYDADRIRKRLEERRKRNFQTEFEADTEERTDIDSILPGWKNIISLAVSYNYRIERSGKKDSLKGYVTKSALGRDYHDILHEKMKKLIALIEEEGCSFRYFCGVDTAPLVDREIAEESGIGFFGKNNSIINENCGSFIFLGYIVTDLEISDTDSENFSEESGKSSEKTLPENRICENCSLCLKACPTGAIREGNMMNARICISYLTQTKDEIPYDLRDRMGKSLYGCDICQNVCPYNRKAPVKENEVYNDEIDLEDIIFISKKGFKEKYGERAFSWRGKNIIKRNAVIALSKIKTEESENILLSQLKDGSEMIRKYSVWALYRQGLSDREKIEEYSGKFREDNLKEYDRIEGFYVKQRRD